MNALAVANVAAAVWVGAIVFQAFFVAPAVFREVDEAGAGRFLRAIFPRFFKLGLACGVVMIASLGAAGAGAGPALAAAVVMTAAAGLSLFLVPRINAARDAGPPAADRFRRLHGASVALTLLVLGLGLVVLVILGRGG